MLLSLSHRITRTSIRLHRCTYPSFNASNRMQCMAFSAMSQAETHKLSLKDPESFWRQAAADISWSKPFDAVLSEKTIHKDTKWYSWFEGGRLNTCHNALDRHVQEGRGEQLALIHESPITGAEPLKLTYNQLLAEVEAVAAVLEAHGLTKGDRCLVYMPMVPQALFVMLACARLGAVHSVVFGGFAAPELAKRIADCKPKVIATASCGLEPKRLVSYEPMLRKAVQISGHRPEVCLHLDRKISTFKESEIETADIHSVFDKTVDWNHAVSLAKEIDVHTDCVEVEASDPLYILYTSGTTGKPKGIQRDNGGHAVAMRWAMKHCMDSQPGDVYFCASDLGWAVGHSFTCYAPLIQGCTTVMLEGKPVGTPDAATYWRIVEQHRVQSLFTAPTALRAICKEDSDGALLQSFDVSSLRAIYIAGERCDPTTLEWTQRMFPNAKVVDNWWQTETGWPISIASQAFGTPIRFGSGGQAVPGYDVKVLDSAQREPTELAPGEFGDIAIRLPLPPGCMSTLWENESGLVESYLTRFPGYYHSGDAGILDTDGYIHIMSRVDDIINIAGHRLSTGGMEQIVARHEAVAECAVIAVDDELKGQVPAGLIVLKDGAQVGEKELEQVLKKMLREEIGAIAVFNKVYVVSQLPKTRSGKILRAILRKIANGQRYVVPGTIEDESVLEEMHAILRPLEQK